MNLRPAITALAVLFVLLPAAAPAAVNAAGLWEGAIQLPNGDLGMSVNLHPDGDKWTGEFDIPAQNAREVPLNEVKVDGAAVSFALPGPGDPRFEGKLSEDGKTLSGNFSQSGASFPLELKWKSEPKKVVRAPANSGEVQVLEGIWEGTLDANGTRLRLLFKFTKNPDGTLKGTIDSLDQDATDIPITSIARTSDSVKLEVKAVGGTYEGTLNKDASSMTGTWHQGGGDLPLSLNRRKAEKQG
jgi:hypothetical protein